MRTEQQSQYRNQLLTALESKRRQIEMEWIKLTDSDAPLSNQERMKRDELEELMDTINREIVHAIVDE